MYDLIDNIAVWLPAVFLVFARLSALLLSMPVFGYATVSGRIRLAIAVVLTLVIAPGVAEAFTVTYSSRLLFGLDIAREIMLGLMLGFGARIIFEGFVMAGSLIGFQMGFAIMNVFDPSTQNNQGIIGSFWLLVVVTFFLVTNSHHLLIEIIFFNFKAIPPASALFHPEAGTQLIGAGAMIYDLAVKFAAPMMMFLLMTDVAIAFMARVMPQLNIFFISLPLKIGIGIFMLLISLHIFQSMFGYLIEYLEGFLLDMVVAIKG